MKVKTEQLSGGRVILHIKENDGSPIVSREMPPQEVMGMFVRWSQSVLKDKQESCITIELPDGKEMVVAIRDAEPVGAKIGTELARWADSYFIKNGTLNSDEPIDAMELWNQYCDSRTGMQKKLSPVSFNQKLSDYFKEKGMGIEFIKDKGIRKIKINHAEAKIDKE